MTICTRCYRPAENRLLCPRCADYLRQYIAAVEECLRAGVPVDSGMIHNAQLDRELLARYEAEEEPCTTC